MNTLVTIGLCTKNSEKTIKQTIDSIINQKYPKELIQLIIVDGQSKDKTISIINDKVKKTRINLETYSDNGQGLGKARQVVIENSKSKYILFVDADVVLAKDFIENDISFLKKNPQFAVAFGVNMVKDGLMKEDSIIAQVSDLAASVLDKTTSVACEATAFLSDAVREVGGFDTRIKGAAEDRDLIVRMRSKGFKVTVNKNAKFLHNQRNTIFAFINEKSWMGHGDHYFQHKHGNYGTFWWKFPFGDFVFSLKLSQKAYRLTNRKLSFLIIPQIILGNLAWWKGFFKGHRNGYGHQFSPKKFPATTLKKQQN